VSRALSPAVTAIVLIVAGIVMGVLLWLLLPAIQAPESYTDISATIICYRNRSTLVLYVKTLDKLRIESIDVNGYKYTVNATAFWEKRIVVDGDACPCTNCNSEFIDGELITSRGVYRVNVFIVQAYAKPLFA
jgi:hypothetical protein